MLKNNYKFLKISIYSFYFLVLGSALSLMMISAVLSQPQSDFYNYIEIISFDNMLHNINSNELLSLIVFKFMTLFENSIATISIFSIFLYLSIIYLLQKIAFQYINKTPYIYAIIIIASGFSFATLSLVQSILRQGLACVIILYLLAYARPISIDPYSFFKKIILFLAAISVHNSLAVFLPFLFIEKNTNTNFGNLILFLCLTSFYLLTAKYLFLADKYTYEYLFMVDKITYIAFFLSIFIPFLISLNNFKNSWIPYLYLNTLVILVVNIDVIYLDRFLYLPWILIPLVVVKFLKNNILIGLFTSLWILVNITYASSRYMIS